MCESLRVPIPLERQLTESKWDSAQKVLEQSPTKESESVLMTPTHVYSVHRESDGTFTRVRTKSHEGTNVDLASSPRSRDLLCLLVGNSTGVSPS
jgi:hypothetical protein